MKLLLKYILFVLLMGILWIPMVQQYHPTLLEVKLDGAFTVPAKPEFSYEKIKTQDYQKELEDYLNVSFGFRNFLIKLKNTVNYYLFKEIAVTDQIEGDRGYIYSWSSVERSVGLQNFDAKRNQETIDKIAFLNTALRKKGKYLFVAFAPSKESILPEYLPEKYKDKEFKAPEYFHFIEGFKRNNIPYVDFYEIFKRLKNKTEFPLYYKTSFHWSAYAASYAQDTLLKHIEKNIHFELPKYKRIGVEISDTARFSDDDFEGPMNLLVSLNEKQYAYPKLELIPSTTKNKRPKVIIIGDSFFWQVKDQKKLMHIFSEDSKYWYYFSQSFPLSDVAGQDIKNLNIINELETADVVILFGSMGTLDAFPYGVDESYYKSFLDTTIVFPIKAKLLATPSISNKIEESAKAKNSTTDQVATDFANAICLNKQTIHLIASNSKYVCTNAANKHELIADKDKPSLWETFTLLKIGENKCVLHSFENKFLSAELNHQNEITATRKEVWDWETFTLIELGKNKIALKAINGKYVSLNKTTLELTAVADKVGADETFEMIIK